MKKIFLYVYFICGVGCSSRSNREATLAVLPSFNMLLMDSATVLKAQEIPNGKPIVLLFFRPDCPHCQAETQAFIDHIDSLKNVQIYLLTIAPLTEIREFYHRYHLDRYNNFTVGRDHEHSFYEAFRPSTIPYTAIYDGNKRLVRIYGQEAGIDNILKAIRI